LNKQKVSDIIPLDIALRRNDEEWFEKLPHEIEDALCLKLYYGHFFCHVFHQDYVVKKGYDAKIIKQKMLLLLNKRRAKYPAEHNVGHLYKAENSLVEFYNLCDPTNSFNPGLGGTSKKKYHLKADHS
jgi:D-lactate dehydrogenase